MKSTRLGFKAHSPFPFARSRHLHDPRSQMEDSEMADARSSVRTLVLLLCILRTSLTSTIGNQISRLALRRFHHLPRTRNFCRFGLRFPVLRSEQHRLLRFGWGSQLPNVVHVREFAVPSPPSFSSQLIPLPSLIPAFNIASLGIMLICYFGIFFTLTGVLQLKRNGGLTLVSLVPVSVWT